MGTFHHDKGELHGITVVVETTSEELFVGRCDTLTDAHIILLGADRHEHGGDGASREEYLRQTMNVGFFPRHERVVLALDQVRSVCRLGDPS